MGRGRFFEDGWGFHGLLVCSVVFLAMMWMILEKVPRVAALWGRLCIVA
jgi:ABC-type multidrug transport system permease subunit